MNILKTDIRTKKTLKIGSFRAREVIKVCPKCGMQYRSKELSGIVAPSCNFGYDILVYVGKALFINHLPDHSIVEQLAAQNIPISLSEIAYNSGYIDANQVQVLAQQLEKNSYGQYLLALLGDATD